MLDIALDDERIAALATSIRSGEAVDLRASAPIRPFLLAALLDSERAFGERPALVVAADDVGARDLAADLGAYLAPRRVRYYPSRGTGYESHLAPPPHLVGLRIAALDALTNPSDEQPATGSPRSSSPPPSPSPRPSPTPRCARRASPSIAARRSTSATSPTLLVEAGYERVEQVDERGQFAIRGGILDVFPATEERAARLELFGDEIESMRWFSTFTQRSLGEAERRRARRPRPSWRSSTASRPRSPSERAAEEARRRRAAAGRVASAAPLDLIARRDARSCSPPPRRSRPRFATTGRT